MAKEKEKGKEKKFKDPLEDVDPVMEEAYSSDDVGSIVDEKKVTVSDIEFPEVPGDFSGPSVERGVFSSIPVKVSVELGRSTISLKEIFDLSEGSIIELDRLVGEPLDLVVNGQIIAQGEVVAIDNNFGLRIKSIISVPKA